MGFCNSALPALCIIVYTITNVRGILVFIFDQRADCRQNIKNVSFWQKYEDVSALEWYEYVPFAIVGGWLIWFLAHIFLLARAGYEKIPEVVPAWIILAGFGIGAFTTLITAFVIYRVFKKREQTL